MVNKEFLVYEFNCFKILVLSLRLFMILGPGHIHDLLPHCRRQRKVKVKLLILQQLHTCIKIRSKMNQWVFFCNLELGSRPIELGKLQSKQDIWEISHFN